jgi:hypothetical protein
MLNAIAMTLKKILNTLISFFLIQPRLINVVSIAVTQLIILLTVLPLISLTLNALAWLRFGVDIPLWDDWGQYSSGNVGRLDLAYLFKSANDTIYAVGLLLDSLAFRFLDGNTIAYQFLSLVSVLGLLLLLQWRLLSICTNNKLIKACAFSITILMIQPDSYWGWQNMAFHQAIPLICVLASLDFFFNERIKLNRLVLFLAGLTVISGLSYISGAFAMLVLGIVFLLLQTKVVANRKRRLFVASISILFPAILTTAAQIWVIIVVQHGTHRSDAPMAFPWEADFWLYFLGKIGRSLMLSQEPMQAGLILFITCAMVLILAIYFASSVQKILHKNITDTEYRLSIIYISLCAVVFIYLLLIAAGRANLRPEEITDSIQIFLFGFKRFHYFWVTILWPWLVIAILSFMVKPNSKNYVAGLFIVILSTVLMAYIKYTAIFDHNTFYRATMERRVEGVHCVNREIQESRNIFCPQLDINELTLAIVYAEQVKASLTRNISVKATPIGASGSLLVFRLKSDLNGIKLVNASRIQTDNAMLEVSASEDPMIFFEVNDKELMKNCKMLEINTYIETEEEDIAQLFYLPSGREDYAEKYSRTFPIKIKDKKSLITFFIPSQNGFSNKLRLDPTTKAQKFKIHDLEVICRLKTLPNKQ